MKIRVDFELCESNALCMEECPEVFLVNEDDELVVLDDNPPAELRSKVDEAVRRCPRQALAIEDSS